MLDVLRRPPAYLLELGAGLLLLAVVNILLRPGDPGFVTVQPHPALVLVALIAARHGLREGLVAGLVTAVLIGACIVLRFDSFRWSEMRNLQQFATPLLLVGTAFGLGALRESHRRHGQELERRVEALEHELADQAVRFMAATEAKHELERRVADETASLSSLAAAARAMETLDPDRLYPAITTTVRRFLQADACQCYVLEGGLLRLRAAEGAAPERADLPPEEGLVGLAIRQGRPASIRDYTLIASLDDLHRAEMLMAAPIVGASGTLLGCITVTALPFLKLTSASLDRLATVADWGARALENARAHEQARARTIEDELVRAYTYAYYQRRIHEEEVRADRYGRPLSVVVFRVHRLGLVAPDRRNDLGRVLSLVFSRTLRDVDIVCRYATDDSFAIILPETTPGQAETVVERLSREIRNFHFAPYADETEDLEFSVRVLAVRERPGGVAS
ncbi:MAG TPA: GAF domain-containing protein [Candidatus Bathyarchaeia archaeon]|nr:GAF domain-containing protein [Candidatus Bathyarchaeia archaeon]